MTDEQEKKAKKAGGWIVRLLTSRGVPGGIARIIAGAVIGAVAAWIALSGAGCTASFSQAADGSLNYSGAIALPIEEGK